MNGADETKGYIIKTVAEKIANIEQHGCPMGALHEQKLNMLEKCSGEMTQSIKEIIRAIDTKMNWIIAAGIILSFMAGVQTLRDVIGLVMK